MVFFLPEHSFVVPLVRAATVNSVTASRTDSGSNTESNS